MCQPLPEMPEALRDIDFEKVGGVLQQHCPGCDCNHGAWLNGVNTDMDTGVMRCRRCGAYRGNAKKTAPRRRRALVCRPVIIVRTAPTSALRPREHRAAPRGRDGESSRDDGGGGDDDGGDGGPPLPTSLMLLASDGGRSA